ncbi:MAG: 50S ribosomal protein L18 [bacterium]
MRKRKIIGTKERPRLSVFRSLNNIYANIIDDTESKTLVAASSLKAKKGGNIAAAKEIGKLIAEKAQAKGLKKVVFDRGSFRFHGRVKALADAAREGGLEF